jgi:hypothetical protein
LLRLARTWWALRRWALVCRVLRIVWLAWNENIFPIRKRVRQAKLPEQLLIATDELCCRQTLAARTRAALLKLERQSHQAGWEDSCGLAIFKFEAHRTKRYVRVRPASGLTALLLAGCAPTGDVGESLALLADPAVDTRREVDSLGVLPAGADAESATAGEEFYGYALRLEGFGTPDPLTRDGLEAAERTAGAVAAATPQVG